MRQVTCLVRAVRFTVWFTVIGPVVRVTVAPTSNVLVFTLTVAVVLSGALTFVLIMIGIRVPLTTTLTPVAP